MPRRAGLERALLEAVGAGAVSSPADVQHFLRCTFMFHLMDYAQVHKAAKAALVCVLRPSREFPVSSTACFKRQYLGSARGPVRTI